MPVSLSHPWSRACERREVYENTKVIQEAKFPVPSVHSDVKVPGLCSSPEGTMH